jgi:superfamily I DNA and/or RNA helicase
LVNKAEVEATVYIFKKIAAHQSRSAQYLYSIGIISMYKQQSQAIERRLEKISQNYPSVQLEIGTVDSFQGREKDAIILGFSETNPNRRRFFYDRRRLNVALSRARELLVIVGNLDKLGASRVVFGVENPLFELRFLIESGIGVCSSKEVFNA